MREQIASLEKDKIWLREQLTAQIHREEPTFTSIDMSTFEPIGGIELPSEKRRRLEEKYRRRKAAAEKEKIDADS